MHSKCVRKDEQARPITECHQGGLSDYQWCKREEIHLGTFYSWGGKLRKAGYIFPESEGKNIGTPMKQEVLIE